MLVKVTVATVWRRNLKRKGTLLEMVDQVKNKTTNAAGDQSGEKTNLRSRISSADKGKRDLLMQLTLKLRAVLVNTPADDKGMVPDTPFSQAGVVRMVELLKQRAGKSDAKGSNVASQMVKRLEANDDKDPAVAGISVAKLQILSKRMSKAHDLSVSKSVRGKRS